jgi:hypothetical protein
LPAGKGKFVAWKRTSLLKIAILMSLVAFRKLVILNKRGLANRLMGG